MTDSTGLFAADTWPSILRSWSRSLRARNRSPRTIDSYLKAAEQIHAHARATGQADLSRRLIEDYLAGLHDHLAPATVAQRYRSLQQLCKWLAAEGELDADPMAGMSPPKVPEQPVAVLSHGDLKALLKACEGTGFTERRDTAVLRLFIDTGMRLGEIAGLATDDLDMDLDVALVIGKGRRERSCPFGDKTGQVLDRYLRARARHPRALDPMLWLGEKNKGALTSSGINQIVKRRGRQAGIEHIHAHMFRHTFAHQWLQSGGTEGDLMRLAGWRSSQMLQRYGASAADERGQGRAQAVEPRRQAVTAHDRRRRRDAERAVQAAWLAGRWSTKGSAETPYPVAAAIHCKSCGARATRLGVLLDTPPGPLLHVVEELHHPLKRAAVEAFRRGGGGRMPHPAIQIRVRWLDTDAAPEVIACPRHGARRSIDGAVLLRAHRTFKAGGGAQRLWI